VEVGQENYDSHADNFVVHKANMQGLDPLERAAGRPRRRRAVAGHARGLDGRGGAHAADQQPGRPRPLRQRLDGGARRRRGQAGGVVYGSSDADGKAVKDSPVSEGDLFATIYQALASTTGPKHYHGTRPVWLTPRRREAVADLL
jgi:hypothetical protein